MTGIEDKTALLEYYRAFKVQADNILDLAPSEVSELFMRGVGWPGRLRRETGAISNGSSQNSDSKATRNQ